MCRKNSLTLGLTCFPILLFPSVRRISDPRLHFSDSHISCLVDRKGGGKKKKMNKADGLSSQRALI